MCLPKQTRKTHHSLLIRNYIPVTDRKRNAYSIHISLLLNLQQPDQAILFIKMPFHTAACLYILHTSERSVFFHYQLAGRPFQSRLHFRFLFNVL